VNRRMRRPYPTASGWDVEVQRFRALFRRWLEYWLKNFFDLTIRGPLFRRYWLTVIGATFLILGFLLHVVFNYIPLFTQVRQFSLTDLPLFVVLTLSRLVIVVLIPSFMAITIAGDYLADIFELKDPAVAWEYISALAMGGASYVLHIRDGKISEESLDSPVLLIGGPGIVLAEFDSAALFEKPDGTPHVIGLASNVPDAGFDPNIVLDGFERLREPIINLRDQYIGNLGGEPITVVSRSLDGIPVSAIDVRGMFSVPRRKPDDVMVSSLRAPYPFDPQDIERILYKQAVPVLIEGPFPSGQPGQWTTAMQGLISGALFEFMSQHRLGEYLSGIGALETEQAEFREDTIVSTTLRFSNDLPDSTDQTPTLQPFHPRTELIERFMRAGDGFPRRARERGLELHWINVGTWKIPGELSHELVTGQHVEAWRLNLSNADRSNEVSARSVSERAFVREKRELIEQVPIRSREKNQVKYADKPAVVDAMLRDYYDQIGEALDAYYEAGASSATSPEVQILEGALLRLERLKPLRAHVVGGVSMSKVRRSTDANQAEDAPPAPETRIEAEQYRRLLAMLDGDYKVAEGLIANEGRRHPGLERIELIQRVVTRFERYKR
jgi:hypothetical protein